MATVLLPRSLVGDVPGRARRLDVEARHGGGRHRRRSRRVWPGMSDRLCEPGPRIRPFINVFVNGAAGGAGRPPSARLGGACHPRRGRWLRYAALMVADAVDVAS